MKKFILAFVVTLFGAFGAQAGTKCEALAEYFSQREQAEEKTSEFIAKTNFLIGIKTPSSENLEEFLAELASFTRKASLPSLTLLVSHYPETKKVLDNFDANEAKHFDAIRAEFKKTGSISKSIDNVDGDPLNAYSLLEETLADDHEKCLSKRANNQ